VALRAQAKLQLHRTAHVQLQTRLRCLGHACRFGGDRVASGRKHGKAEMAFAVRGDCAVVAVVGIQQRNRRTGNARSAQILDQAFQRGAPILRTRRLQRHKQHHCQRHEEARDRMTIAGIPRAAHDEAHSSASMLSRALYRPL
jgi:hypothetical protein